MLALLQSAVSKLVEGHPVRSLDEWHLQQIIRQMKLRETRAMLPPFCEIEQYKGQNKLLTSLYIYLNQRRESAVLEVLDGLDAMGIRKLLWQRFTTHSTTDLYTLPPSGSQLADAMTSQAETPDIQTQLYQNNCGEEYWEVMFEELNDSTHENTVTMCEVTEFFLDSYTWWNTFKHKQHGTVYELRDPTGHGLRVTLANLTFIELLEPNTDDGEHRFFQNFSKLSP